LRNVPVDKVTEFEKEFLMIMENRHKDTLDGLAAGKLDDSITDVIEKVAADLSSKYV
jgi:F-type H+/Na+-transporting ATPase subunit alpha